ncbi:nuclear transport factor 2 family protein [Mycolicibacterium neoaurum]|uniref:nuclear transport factor 2 family protein n=1 Tax=Mycolicibacterium neoaurum TaxID=1795 RepID=UPI001BCB0A0B|nr:nuclear transport factor 2 family protein [Mycolicibacterium neoaurum]QVI27275.1 nuclear transport factor 2 family protein [Mycolicibacterium neoaurum]
MNAPREIVLALADELFVKRDLTAVDRWIHPGYIQHNPAVPDGPEGIREFIGASPADAVFELHRVIADGSLVALQSSLHGVAPDPLATIDIFRVQDGKLIEHWDGMQPIAADTDSDSPAWAGATHIKDADKTEQNRDLVTSFIADVLTNGEIDRVCDYVDTARYRQHPTGGAGDSTAADQAQAINYTTVHHVVAEGDLVVTLTEGTSTRNHSAFFDIFRVEDNKIVERWNVTSTVPTEAANDNGMF